jgi:hypothetical protein
MDSTHGFVRRLNKMSAITKFFEQARMNAQRLRDARKNRVVPIEHAYIVDHKKLDEAYQTLMNWKIYYEQDLLDYYESLDQEEYEYILSKKHEFPKEVQTVLWGQPPMYTFHGNISLKCVDYTDSMFLAAKAKEQKKLDDYVNVELAKIVFPSRPVDSIDDKLTELREMLTQQEETLDKLMKAPTKKYVAPSMRKQVMLSDPDVQAAQALIEKTKNEISLYETYVQKADDDWRSTKRYEAREKIIQEMYAV